MGAYQSSQYAFSMAEFGRPRRLNRSEGWILEREIPGSTLRDAMGCYPLFSCRNWEELPADLRELESDLISLVLVTDPFGAYDAAFLERCFNCGAVPFKHHHVVELGRSVEQIVSPDHRRKARKAFGQLTVEWIEDPAKFLDEWVALYGGSLSESMISVGSGLPLLHFLPVCCPRPGRVPGHIRRSDNRHAALVRPG